MMTYVSDVFENFTARPATQDGIFSEDEVRLANRNAGLLLETLHHDITPTGLHYLLIHFDVPELDTSHQINFVHGFEAPFSLSHEELLSLPQLTLPVTLECAGNGRSGMSPRTHSMPWGVEAVGTSEWTGTLLAPLIERAKPARGTVDFAFIGADRGFDKGQEHYFGRSLSVEQLASLDVMLVHSMNGQPMLPQHGAPFRIIVPGWYGMASVKWLTQVQALQSPFQGFQQIKTYRYRQHRDDPGQPVTDIRIKSLMKPPGLPDWTTRFRHLQPGPVDIVGRAWSGNGVPIRSVEFSDGTNWFQTQLFPAKHKYAWSKWTYRWQAKPGEHILRCRATDQSGESQPLEPRWDAAGFGNNVVQKIQVFVGDGLN